MANHTAVVVARHPQDGQVAERYYPWRDLRGREHIDFRLAPLPHDLGAVYWPRGDRAAIVIDPALDQRERAVALAHELVHDERGGGCMCPPGMPEAWSHERTKDETCVRREVARRFVPLDQLEVFVERRLASDLTTTVLDVAEEFNTTEQMAELAMLLMKGEAA